MRTILSLLLLVFIFVPGDASSASNIYTKVTAEEIIKMQKDMPDLVIIDVRGEDQITDGMIKGAINLPVYHFKAEALAKVISDKGTPVLLYCNDIRCGASALAAGKAHKIGYTNLYKYPGGIADWEEKGLPVQK